MEREKARIQIVVRLSTYLKLVELKEKLKVSSIDGVIRELLKYYESRG